MDIEIIEPCGYSKTLANLLDVATKARYSFPSSKIVLLGSVLNGEQVKNELFRLNIDIVDIPYEGFADYLNNLDKDTLVITSPYGTEDKLFKIMNKRKILYFDATSPVTIEKVKAIKKARFGKKIIYVGNSNTIEESYLASVTNHNFFLYDLANNENNLNSSIFTKRLNKSKNEIIYQSEIANETLSSALFKIKSYLDKVTVNNQLSDENFDKKKILLEKIKNGDVLLIVSSTKKSDKFLLEYYHLTTKNVLYATISNVQEALSLKIPNDKKIYLISDGSVSRKGIEDIYNYFRYKGIQEYLLDQHLKSQIQRL